MSAPLPSSPTPFHSNYIFAALPAADFERFAVHLKPCLLHLGQTLCEKGDPVETLYFPKNGLISLMLTSQSGIDVEVGLIGREGVLGGLEVLGEDLMMVRAMVQIAGSGWKISAEALRRECTISPALQTAILRHSHTLMQQTAQGVLCNRLHTVEKRLARWLLMAQDRMHTDTLELTHEFIATMLGTRRVGVTLAAGILREDGLIDYKRGLVKILDRPGLEARACECYESFRSSFNKLLPQGERGLSLNGAAQLNHTHAA